MLILLGSPESTIAAGRATLMQGTKDNRTTKRSLRPTHVRTVALAATIVGVVVLPIAAANANPLHSGSSKQPSVTGTPALTSRTARYRCPATDTSTSANPGLPPPDARKRRETGKAEYRHL